MVSFSIQSLGAVVLVLALGNVVSAAPTLTSDYDLTPDTVEEALARRTQTGYDTYKAFMDASAAYHALTEGEYTAARNGADGVYTVDMNTWVMGLRAVPPRAIPVAQLANARALTQRCGSLQAAQLSATKIYNARMAALNNYGHTLVQQRQMTQMVYDNHVEQANGYRTAAQDWATKYANCLKVKQKTTP